MHYSGLHLMIDAFVKPPHSLNDANSGNIVLEKIVETIGMTMILPPITVKFPHAVCEMTRVLENLEKENLKDSNTYKLIKNSLDNRKLQTYGFSTLVMIAESHLSLHTFPEFNFLTFDAYSCKPFEFAKVKDILNSFFSFEKINIKVIKRELPF